jgi:hypothetical protein
MDYIALFANDPKITPHYFTEWAKSPVASFQFVFLRKFLFKISITFLLKCGGTLSYFSHIHPSVARSKYAHRHVLWTRGSFSFHKVSVIHSCYTSLDHKRSFSFHKVSVIHSCYTSLDHKRSFSFHKLSVIHSFYTSLDHKRSFSFHKFSVIHSCYTSLDHKRSFSFHKVSVIHSCYTSLDHKRSFSFHKVSVIHSCYTSLDHKRSFSFHKVSVIHSCYTSLDHTRSKQVIAWCYAPHFNWSHIEDGFVLSGLDFPGLKCAKTLSW